MSYSIELTLNAETDIARHKKMNFVSIRPLVPESRNY